MGPTVFCSSPRRLLMSNHLWMSEQRKHILLSWYGRGLNPQPLARMKGAYPIRVTWEAVIS